MKVGRRRSLGRRKRGEMVMFGVVEVWDVGRKEYVGKVEDKAVDEFFF